MSKEERVKKIAKRLKEVCKDKGIKQTELATMIGVSQPTIAEILNGNRAIGAKNAVKLNEALGIELDFLLTAEDNTEINNIEIHRSGNVEMKDRSQYAQGNITNSTLSPYETVLLRQAEIMAKQQEQTDRVLTMLENLLAKINTI